MKNAILQGGRTRMSSGGSTKDVCALCGSTQHLKRTNVSSEADAKSTVRCGGGEYSLTRRIDLVSAVRWPNRGRRTACGVSEPVPVCVISCAETRVFTVAARGGQSRVGCAMKSGTPSASSSTYITALARRGKFPKSTRLTLHALSRSIQPP